MGEDSPVWPEEMDAEDRVSHVATTRTTPRNAGWIAREAAAPVSFLETCLHRLPEKLEEHVRE